jgi:hypothetical protein
VHRLYRPWYGFPAFLWALWREQHPRQALQLELPLAASGATESLLAIVEQLGMFAGTQG